MIVHSTEFKTNMGKYLDLLEKEDLYIFRNGKPVGEVVSHTYMSDVDLLRENADADSFEKTSISYEEFIERYEKTEERSVNPLLLLRSDLSQKS